MHDNWRQVLNMHDSISNRLKKARERAGYADAKAAAVAMGANFHTYIQHENGTRGFAKHAERYARFFRVDIGWLLSGKGKPKRSGEVGIIGYVGAGAEVYPFDDHAQGAALDTVELGTTPENAVGVRIRGDSMYPFEEGWVLVYRRDAEGVPSTCMNQLCICKVARDGPMLVKRLRKSNLTGHFNLESWNASLREDVELEWAAQVLLIVPQ